MKVRIRDARRDECDELTELCFRSKAFWGYDATFLAKCRDALAITPTKLENWCVRVAELNDGRPVGVLAISFEKATPDMEAEVERLFVDPSFVRAGVGRALMSHARQLARDRGANWLNILSDPGAEPFYTGLGAIRAGLRPSDAISGRTLPWLRLFVGHALPQLRTERLLLRPWRVADRVSFSELNADQRVAQYLPGTLTRQESDALASRLQEAFERYGFGRWAVERVDLPNRPFVGFIGLAVPDFELAFAPCVEIGWRLGSEHWGIGLATEGARAVVHYARYRIGLDELVSFTVPENVASRRVMEKIGMHHDAPGDFEHPRLPKGHPLRQHVLYRVRWGVGEDVGSEL